RQRRAARASSSSAAAAVTTPTQTPASTSAQPAAQAAASLSSASAAAATTGPAVGAASVLAPPVPSHLSKSAFLTRSMLPRRASMQPWLAQASQQAEKRAEQALAEGRAVVAAAAQAHARVSTFCGAALPCVVLSDLLLRGNQMGSEQDAGAA